MRRRLTAILLTTVVFSLPITMFGIKFLLGPADRETPDMQDLAYGLALFMIFVLSLSSTTIYLNLLPGIRNSRVYSISSFFLLPIISAILSIASMDGFKHDRPIFSMMVIPFFVIMAFHYVIFQNRKPGVEA
jgi:O-antigen/teichoic acid export membrane protein